MVLQPKSLGPGATAPGPSLRKRGRGPGAAPRDPSRPAAFRSAAQPPPRPEHQPARRPPPVRPDPIPDRGDQPATQPAYAATATIYLLFPFGRATDRTSYWTSDELTLADLSKHTHFIGIRDGHIDVPPSARPALRAYRTFRHTVDGAEDSDLLFPPQRGGRHARTLADIGMRDLPKTPRPERVTVYDHATAWMADRHLSLCSLATAPRSLELRSPTWT
jgi:hypothetical protein